MELKIQIAVFTPKLYLCYQTRRSGALRTNFHPATVSAVYENLETRTFQFLAPARKPAAATSCMEVEHSAM